MAKIRRFYIFATMRNNGVNMKKIFKFLCVVLSVVMIFSSFTMLAATTDKSIVISSINVKANTASSITVTLNGFEDFVGGYKLKLYIPDFITVSSVWRDSTELTNELDYKIANNELRIIEDIGYADTDKFSSSTVYTVNFSAGVAQTGKYTVSMLDGSYFVNDSDLSKLDAVELTTVGIIDFEGTLKADINTDGRADAIDVTALRKYLLNIEQTGIFSELVADINADGNIDVLDIVAFKKYLIRTVVYLSDKGSDSNSGTTADSPVASLNKAIDLVYEGGTVQIVDSYTLDSGFVWDNHLKSVVITGGTLDASAVHPLKINDNVKFTDCTVTFQNNANVYANGNKLVIDSNVKVNNLTHLYGGGTKTVENTDITVLSGSYYDIIGGGNGSTGTVLGDTNVTVGGNVNNDSEFDVTNHNLMRRIIGGTINGTVGGNTNITVKDNAQSINIYGAGKGAKSSVAGKSIVTILGGTHMSAYGGAYEGIVSDTELNFNGGTIQQLFGGCLGTSMTGNTQVNVLGGTVTRRIYGGCYNEASQSGFSLKWATDYYVTGNTNVFLSADADVIFDTNYNDYGIFACTRYGSHFGDENSTLTYEDSAAQSEFSGKIGQKQSLLSFYFPSAAKTIETKN